MVRLKTSQQYYKRGKLMKFLASLTVALTIIAYIYVVTLITSVCPWWLDPFVEVLALTLCIYVTTKDNKR